MDTSHNLRVQDPEKKYKLAAKYIKKADVIYITAGAGMGVGSGLATFRGAAASTADTWCGCSGNVELPVVICTKE